MFSSVNNHNTQIASVGIDKFSPGVEQIQQQSIAYCLRLSLSNLHISICMASRHFTAVGRCRLSSPIIFLGMWTTERVARQHTHPFGMDAVLTCFFSKEMSDEHETNVMVTRERNSIKCSMKMTPFFVPNQKLVAGNDGPQNHTDKRRWQTAMMDKENQ